MCTSKFGRKWLAYTLVAVSMLIRVARVTCNKLQYRTILSTKNHNACNAYNTHPIEFHQNFTGATPEVETYMSNKQPYSETLWFTPA